MTKGRRPSAAPRPLPFAGHPALGLLEGLKTRERITQPTAETFRGPPHVAGGVPPHRVVEPLRGRDDGHTAADSGWGGSASEGHRPEHQAETQRELAPCPGEGQWLTAPRTRLMSRPTRVLL